MVKLEHSRAVIMTVLHSFLLLLLQGIIVLIPSFFIIAYAYHQSVLYVGLVLFSFGKNALFTIVD